MSVTILIVDDERPVRMMVGRLVKSLGYMAEEAESGEAALALLSRTAVDLVITDLKMPGMDGLSLAQKLLEENRDRPVLLMTAYADLESARRAVSIGVYEYFTKPFDVSDVGAGINRALEHRRLVLENKAYQKDLERKVEERTRELRQKVQELEARDSLLRHMLSIQEPEETLGLAVKLALDLCDCDTGALYTVDGSGGTEIGAAAGFGGGEEPLSKVELETMNLKGSGELDEAQKESLENQTRVWVHEPGEVRKGFGIHSVGILPVQRGDEVVALLEVGRKRQDVLVGESDMDALQGFLPYVAMAVMDSRLQDEIPEWEDEMEGVLDEAGKWEEE